MAAVARCELVGPNGAGKTTLLNLVTGLLIITIGRVRVFGRPLEVSRVAFVAQDKPLYRRWSVVDLLRFGAATNPRWDQHTATSFLLAHDIPVQQRADRLSGGAELDRPSQPVLLHFDGRNWTLERMYEGRLEALAAIPGGKDIWAVGRPAEYTDYGRETILRRDGQISADHARP
ncbi:ATP-binding cassette domain-containing protein [Nonomuraea sp. NBC_00507]|uniref:ATP-binding cassette domain-containing protein n=1 Tax=Nonomuraea sp. NBC_00507 TaxID=2976002 RepID=UPI003FA57FF3